MLGLYDNLLCHRKIILHSAICILTIMALFATPGYPCDINLTCDSVTNISIVEFPIHDYDNSYYTMHYVAINIDTLKIDMAERIDTCKDSALNFKSGNYTIYVVDPSKPQSLKFPPSQGQLYHTDEMVLVFFNSKRDAAKLAKLICQDKFTAGASHNSTVP